MPDVLHEVTIAAAPDKVYKALTEQQGLEAWWTTHAVAEAKVGSTVQAHFRDGQIVIKMEVVTLSPAHKVEWMTLQAIPEWRGTQITWELSPAQNGTKVFFGHRGFAPEVGLLPINAWAFYLTSLKEYLETGKGNPGGYIHDYPEHIWSPARGPLDA